MAADERKTNFQLVCAVLDELWAEVKQEHGRKAVPVILEKLEALSAAYGDLRNPELPPIDYTTPATRFAYVYAYVATHADYVFQLLNNTRKRLWDSLEGKERLVATCLGGGPGTELVGLLQFLSHEETPPETLTVYLCDREQAWADSWTEIGEEVPSALRLNVNFQPLDVTNPKSWSKQKKFLSADLFALVYFVSEVMRMGDAADAFWDELGSKAKSGALMLIADNDHKSFIKYIERNVIGDRWEVLANDSRKLVASFWEEKNDLGRHLEQIGRSPKLKADLVYWVLRKK